MFYLFNDWSILNNYSSSFYFSSALMAIKAHYCSASPLYYLQLLPSYQPQVSGNSNLVCLFVYPAKWSLTFWFSVKCVLCYFT